MKIAWQQSNPSAVVAQLKAKMQLIRYSGFVAPRKTTPIWLRIS